MNINEHPIYKNIYDLCQEIEKLPASEQATKVVVMASALENPVRDLLEKKKVLVEALETLFEAFIELNHGCYPLPLSPESERYKRIACDKAKQALEACNEL